VHGAPTVGVMQPPSPGVGASEDVSDDGKSVDDTSDEAASGANVSAVASGGAASGAVPAVVPPQPKPQYAATTRPASARFRDGWRIADMRVATRHAAFQAVLRGSLAARLE
jgi:hypothetical protein